MGSCDRLKGLSLLVSDKTDIKWVNAWVHVTGLRDYLYLSLIKLTLNGSMHGSM